jgi:hypothetical protein
MEKSMTDPRMIAHRGKALAEMGLVEKDYDGFNVISPGIKRETFRIWRDEQGKVRCNCTEFEEQITLNRSFRCEHIWAVKYHLTPEAESQSQDEASLAGMQGPAAGESRATSTPQQLLGRHPDDLPFTESPTKRVAHALALLGYEHAGINTKPDGSELRWFSKDKALVLMVVTGRGFVGVLKLIGTSDEPDALIKQIESLGEEDAQSPPSV